MNRIKEWLEQDPQRMHFIKIGLVLLGIILLIALPTLYLVLSGVGIWYFVKKAPDIRKRNLMIGLFIVSFVAVALQTPAKEKAEEERIAKEKAANELQEKGEDLVKQLEESQDASQVKSAKETVNQIENNDKKAELLDRIGAVESLISQKEEKRIAHEAETKAQQQDRIVYVADHGNAKVYWYSKDRMTSKTNKANVVEMTEADAIAAGKRPSKKE